MWFSGALIKLVIIPWKSSTKWESRLIRKPTKLLHSVERSGNDLIADRMCPQKYFFIREKFKSTLKKKWWPFLIHLNVIIFDFFLFFLVSHFGAVLSPYHECVQFFFLSTFTNVVLISIFLWFLFCSLMLHWSQDYDEFVFVRLLNFDFSWRRKNMGKSGRNDSSRVLLCRFVLHIFYFSSG